MWAAVRWSPVVADSPQTEQMMTMSASQQQQRVRWVWPRSEIGGRSFKGRREPSEGREKVLQDMSQTSVSSHKQWPQPGIHKFCQRRRTVCDDYGCRKVRKNHIFVVCVCAWSWPAGPPEWEISHSLFKIPAIWKKWGTTCLRRHAFKNLLCVCLLLW